MVPQEVFDLHDRLTGKIARAAKLSEKIAGIVARYRTQVVAVETTMKLLSETPEETVAMPPPSPPRFHGGGEPMPLRPTNLEVELAFGAVPPAFTIRDLIRHLGPPFAESDIARSIASNFLRRLEDEGKVRVAERGTGRRPSTYMKEVPRLVRAIGPTVRLYPEPETPEPTETIPTGDSNEPTT